MFPGVAGLREGWFVDPCPDGSVNMSWFIG